ncbi:MAG: GxxExxY protein [bacterium]
MGVNHGSGYKHTDLTELIIKAFNSAYKKLGYGFLEKVYMKALICVYLRRLRSLFFERR